jgi:hypothetical protein
VFQLCFNYLNRIHDSVGKALRTVNQGQGCVMPTLMYSVLSSFDPAWLYTIVHHWLVTAPTCNVLLILSASYFVLLVFILVILSQFQELADSCVVS